MDRFLGALLREIDLVGRPPWAAGPSRFAACSSAGARRRCRRADAMAAVLERLRGALRARRPGPRSPSSAIPESVSPRPPRGLSPGGREPDQPGRAEPRRPRSCRARSPPLGAPGASAAFEAARAGRIRQHQRRSHLRPSRPRSGHLGGARCATCSAGSPDHLSAYALTLDEGSLWHAAGVTALPDGGRDHRAVLGASPRLAARGGLRALRGLQLRAARTALAPTTRSTGAPRSISAWGRAPRASWATSGTPTSSRSSGTASLVGARAASAGQPRGPDAAAAAWPSASSSACALATACPRPGSTSGSARARAPARAARRVARARPARRGRRPRAPHRGGLPPVRRAVRRVAVTARVHAS